MRSRSIYRAGCALLAACLCLCCRESAGAGTTGTITGTVVNAETKAPIAGADVSVASPSQVARVTTDASGRFTFLSLGPETYTISVQHAGYTSVSITGISVFADQSQSIPIALQKSLKEIARVISRSSLSPVRPGTGTDVYSVNPGLAAAAATLGGGGGLNNAYSAIAAMPELTFRPIRSASIKPCISGAATTTRSVTNTMACRSIGPSITIPETRRRRWANRNCKFIPAAAKPTPMRPALPASSTKSSRPEPIRATQLAALPAARRRSITTRASRPAARRPTGCSPTTSASAERIKIFGISINSTAPR